MIGPRVPRRPRPVASVAAGLAATMLATLCGGCASPGPAGLAGAVDRDALVREVAPGNYEATFDAAVAVLKDHGLDPAVRDRRSGVIETSDRIGAGWFEPWRLESSSNLETTASLSTVRRRARIEFSVPGANPATIPGGTHGASGASDPGALGAESAADGGPAAGADLFGVRGPATELNGLMASDGPIEIRVWVTVERAHRPGLRVDTWSRRLTTQAKVNRPGAGRDFEPTTTWWPVARDPGLEAALLREIAERSNVASG
ncbi:MAG: hypothetical protein AB8G96_00740 [Phycisphaerales bacterium]